MSTLTMTGPILRALRGHRASVTLLVLQIALTLAVLCNLVFVVSRTWQRMDTPTGAMEADIGLIQSIGVIGSDANTSAGRNLAALQSTPGVIAAAYGGPPLWRPEHSAVFLDAQSNQPSAHAYVFAGSQGLDKVLGVTTIAGRSLHDDELPTIAQMFFGDASVIHEVPGLVTPSLAKRLYGSASPLGKLLYTSFGGGRPVALRIVGVIAPLRGEILGHDDDADAIIVEIRVANEGIGGGYMIRSQPGQIDKVLPLAAKAMQKVAVGQVQNQVTTMRQLRSDYFKSDEAVAGMLLAIMVILLVVTALGISGLASFWVQQRTRQIGIRRALGATRRSILHHFQLENFLIVSGGIAVGTLLAFALNQWLMQHYELERLTTPTVLAGIFAVWLLGQLAVLGPALRAAAVPPAIATRSA